MTKKRGRAFEELVARLKAVIEPKGAVVLSPEYVLDLDTGARREVDVTIRFIHDGIPILVTVECRDRRTRDDVRWIEELVSKKEGIGATRTVAVSHAGFSAPAITKAAKRGIELRTITDITATDIASWSTVTSVTVNYSLKGLEGLRLDLRANPDGEELVLDPYEQDGGHPGLLDSLFITRLIDGRTFSPRHLIIEWQKTGRDLFEDVPLDGTRVRRRIGTRIAPGCLGVRANGRMWDISCWIAELDVWHERRVVPHDRMVEYASPALAVAQRQEWRLDLLGTPAILSLQHDLASGETLGSVTLEPPTKPNPARGSRRRSQ